MVKNTRFDTAFNSYSTVRVIGEGGSGIVYEVSDDDSSIYALKLLSKNQVSNEKAKRFKNEINFCSKETHGNIIRVLDSGFWIDKHGKRPFYVMPLYRETLRDLINKKIPAANVLLLFSQILDGVEAAHLLNIWHRDIKPENILYDTSSNKLVVADFGIAHFNKDELLTCIQTKPDSRLANFQYAAPEQREKGALVDHRADIFALGLILNEMFTGQVPHGDGYKKISEVSTEFSYLDEIVSKMIQRSLESRFDSIKSIKEQLIARKNEFVSHQRIDALKTTIVPSSEVSDPLIASPIEYRSCDIDADMSTLSFELNHSVPPQWIKLFRDIHELNGLGGAMPFDYQFRGNQAYLSCVGENSHLLMSVNFIIDLFKKYVAQTNEKYKQSIVAENRYREQQYRQQLQEQLEKEQKRLRLLQSIKQ